MSTAYLKLRKRRAVPVVTGVAVAAVLACSGGSPALAADAAAPSSGHQTSAGQLNWRQLAAQYADAHWSWTAWNDRTPVKAGTPQPKFQCAEFAARALAAAGLVPGLQPDDPQDAYYHYKAPGGKEYNLLLISDVTGYNSLYDYLMDFGLGTDLGDQPQQAKAGDVLVQFDKAGTAKLHTALIADSADEGVEPTADAHNYARYHYDYHLYHTDARVPHVIQIHPGAVNGLRAEAQPPADPNLIRVNADPGTAS